MNVKTIYDNVLISLILFVVIFLSLSFLSPCFQSRYLDDKNLYQYIKDM